jgi:hypothetical protein
MLGMTACGKKEDKSLYEHGLDLADTIVEAAEVEEYWEAMGIRSENFLAQMENIIEGKYKEPQKVYALTVSHEGLSNMLEDMDLDVDDLSEDLQNLIGNKMFGSLANQVNARGGSDSLVVSSVLNATKTFVCDKLESNCMYIYLYKKGTPISVTFIKGEDGSVSATATFLMAESLGEDLEEALEDIEVFEELGIEIEEVDME